MNKLMNRSIEDNTKKINMTITFFQLESQREYFESKLTRVQEEATKQIQELSDRKNLCLFFFIF